ncbi:MAG: BON domain-containing protein [Armatimonadota bacterium]
MRILTTIGLALAVMGLAGCNQNRESQVDDQVAGFREQVQTATEQAQSAARNAALESKIKTVLLSRKGLNAKEIDVQAQGDRVVLKGDVADVAQARLAEETAMEVEGVTSVDNQLMIRVPATQVPVTPQTREPLIPQTREPVPAPGTNPGPFGPERFNETPSQPAPLQPQRPLSPR